jgi:hypothetical protein
MSKLIDALFWCAGVVFLIGFFGLAFIYPN